MKIGIVSPYNMFLHGGVQEHIYAQAAILESRGHEVTIIAPKPREIPKTVPDNVLLMGQVARMKVNAPFHTEFDLSLKVTTSEINDMFEEKQFDVLHMHEPTLPLLPYQLLQRADMPIVGTLHARWPRSYINKFMEWARTPYLKATYKRIDRITAVSEVAALNIAEIELDKHVQIIPNGIDLHEYKPAAVDRIAKYDDDMKTIVFIGRLEKRKGVMNLLKAYKRLKRRDPNYRLVIAGKGAKHDRMMAYIERYNLEDVEFLGYVSTEEKMQLLKTATVFCSPALYGESFGIVLLEAMAMGAVIVAGDNEGYSSVMHGEGANCLVDPDDYDELADALERYASDEELRKRYSSWAKDYVQQYDYRAIVTKYEAAYKELIDGNTA